MSPEGVIQDTLVDDPGYLVREIEAHMIFSLATAKGLREWLSNQINAIETLQLVGPRPQPTES